MTNTSGQYQWMRKVLKNMDEKQLVELFHDLEDIEAVERIADVAYHFVENYVLDEECQCDCKEKDFMCKKGTCTYKDKSQYAEAKEVDDLQRYRDSQKG